MVSLALSLGGEVRHVEVRRLIVAGWAGRDQTAVKAHIHELEALGVTAPSATPVFYRVGAARLTTDETIEVLGPDSSGEVEAVLLHFGGELWVGVGSDHTDRKAEALGVALSKQLCDKPVGRDFWRFSEVRDHWDRLQLRAFRHERGQHVLYQDGVAAALLPPTDLIERLGGELEEGSAMFCGTVGAIGGIRPADALDIELHDPVLNRTLSHSYRAATLPLVA